MDFNNHIVTEFNIGGFTVAITESMVDAWIISAVIILVSLYIRMKIKNPQKIPSGIQNAIELIVDGLDKFVVSTMGEKGIHFASFYGGMFLYIMLCNISGLFIGPDFTSDHVTIGFMRPPTADLALTFALALITFFMTQGFGIKAKGLGKWGKGFLEPMAPLLPLNIIGELANPVSLSFRLFGNILGGTIIMGLYYNIPFLLVKLGIPSILHGYFDVFAGVLQAFIFVMLSMTFVGSAMDD